MTDRPAANTPLKPRATREEIARVELGHTDLTPAAKWLLVLGLIASILVVPIWQHVHDIRANLREWQSTPPEQRTWTMLLPQFYDIVALAPDREAIYMATTWWGAFLFSGAVNSLGNRIGVEATTASETIRAAWVGIVPFRMEGVRVGKLPPFPWTSSFPELNLRTYVTDNRGRPGVWFFSLDAGSRIAVWTARTFFHLNYRKARMKVQAGADGRIVYRSRRSEPGEPMQEFAWARPSEPDLTDAGDGTLEHFLVERYRLFAWDRARQKLFTGRVAHVPYRIWQVPVNRYSTRLFALNGLGEPEGPPDSILAAPGFDVEIFPMETVG